MFDAGFPLAGALHNSLMNKPPSDVTRSPTSQQNSMYAVLAGHRQSIPQSVYLSVASQQVCLDGSALCCMKPALFNLLVFFQREVRADQHSNMHIPHQQVQSQGFGSTQQIPALNSPLSLPLGGLSLSPLMPLSAQIAASQSSYSNALDAFLVARNQQMNAAQAAMMGSGRMNSEAHRMGAVGGREQMQSAPAAQRASPQEEVIVKKSVKV